MYKYLLFPFGILFLIGCDNVPESPKIEAFSLEGQTHQMADNSKIYLLDINNNQIVDSTLIQENHFHFEGQLKESPSQMALLIDGQVESKTVWLENAEMEFLARNKPLDKGILLGSATDLDAQRLDSLMLSANQDYEAEIAIAMEFILEHPESRVSAYILENYAPSLQTQTLQKLFKMLSDENKTSIFGRRIQAFLKESLQNNR